MAFLYVVMQGLPRTLPHFQSSMNAVSTFANILYGGKRYINIWLHLRDIYYVAMVTAGLTPLYIHLIKYKPWQIGVYVSYTPAYVRKFICDISLEPQALGK